VPDQGVVDPDSTSRGLFSAFLNIPYDSASSLRLRQLVQTTARPLDDDLRLRRLLCGKAEPFRGATGEAPSSDLIPR
jgi:hypothetical protein